MIGQDFSGCDLKFALFDNCDLSSARFDNANLFKARFRNCVLYNASFDNAVLVDVCFEGSSLFGIRFGKAHVYGAVSLSQMLTREYHDTKQQHLAFRGTAGRAAWKRWRVQNGNAQHDAVVQPNGRRVVRTSAGTQLLASETGDEVIERGRLHAEVFWQRWARRPSHDECYPNPPGDAWAEDATSMMLRGYRDCLEHQGREYQASQARYWEQAYRTAAAWRVLQSRLLGADCRGRCTWWRWLCAHPAALVATSLLHPSDTRRYASWFGRSIRPSPPHLLAKHGGRYVWARVFGCLVRQWQWPGRKETPSSAHGATSNVSRNPEEVDATPNHSEVRIRLREWWTYILQFLMAALITATLLQVLVHMSISGAFVLLLCIGGVVGVMYASCGRTGRDPNDTAEGEDHGQHDNRVSRDEMTGLPKMAVEGICGYGAESIRFGRAVYRFAQHVICGYGERPMRAVAALGAWIVMFGLFYAWMGPNEFHVGDPRLAACTWQFGHAMYYSVVNATTLGFGDVVPRSDLMERLASIEVLGAIFFTAVLLASVTRKFVGK
ncbi:MAG: pentapeptide repeat-containing protein [Dehalococcoidia bacterium]|nr:pentapeptide repeat-containing protein [Dehalococcoidia bacterium]